MIDPIAADMRSAMSGVLADVQLSPAELKPAGVSEELRFEVAMAPPEAPEAASQVQVAVDSTQGTDPWVLPPGTHSDPAPQVPTCGRA